MKNSIKLIFTIILVFGLGLSFALAQTNIFRLTVKEDRKDCVGVVPQKCLQVKYSNSKDWENFYGTIAGFKYEEGYQYQLRVRRTKLKNVPADASSYKYELVKVVKKTKVKTAAHSIENYLGKYDWNLIQMNGKSVKDGQPTISFDTSKGRVYGSSGCNRYFGEVKIGANKMTFDKMASTMMLCDEERNQVEREYMMLIQDASITYDVSDQTLNFYKDNKLILMFARGVEAKH